MVIAGIICGVIGYIYFESVQKEKGRYLTFRNGTETKVFLVDSHLSYGVFEENILIPIKGRSANVGDPAVIINGTIRNDYEKDYYFAITGYLYTSKGEKLEGSKYIFDPPIGEFAVTYVPAHGIGTFEMHFKYEGRDIESYDLFLYMEPQETPPS